MVSEWFLKAVFRWFLAGFSDGFYGSKYLLKTGFLGCDSGVQEGFGIYGDLMAVEAPTNDGNLMAIYFREGIDMDISDR